MTEHAPREHRAVPEHLLEGLRASRRPRRHRGAEGGPDARHGRAQADRVALRARAAPVLPRQLGPGRRAPAARPVGLAHAASARSSTCPRTTTCTSPHRCSANAQAIGSSKPMIVIDSTLLERLGPGEQRVVARPRARPHPLRPRALHDRAQHPAAAPAAACRSSSGSRSARSGPCCSSGTAPPSSAATAPRRSPSAIPQIVCRTLMVTRRRACPPTSSTSTRS